MQAVKNSKDKWHHFSGELPEKKTICGYSKARNSWKECIHTNFCISKDTLKIVTSLREAKSVIYSGKIKVDGVIRKSLHHGIGLMDVVELEGSNKTYRLVPQNGTLLKPIEIDDAEKTKKFVLVKAKTTVKMERLNLVFMMVRHC